MEEIIAAAKKEGKLVLYSSRPTDMENPVVAAFKQKYGIDVELYRAGGEDVTRKYELEVKANQHRVDFMHHSDIALAISLARRGLLLKGFFPPNLEAVPKEYKDPDGQWSAVTMMNIILVYNPKLVKEEDAPKAWKELLDPKWKGKVAIHSPFWASDALFMAEGLRGLYGWEFFKKLKANDVIEVNGAGDVENLVVAGERLVGTYISNRGSLSLTSGRPIKLVWPEEGAVLAIQPVMAFKNAPHPNAAKLYYDYVLSQDTARVYASVGNYSSRTDAPTPPHLPKLGEKKLIHVDANVVLDKRDEIKDNWRAAMG